MTETKKFKYETFHDSKSMTHVMGKHYSVVYQKAQGRIVTFKDGEQVDEIAELKGLGVDQYERYLFAVAEAEARLAQLEGDA